jgi:hypothetical protein
MSLAERGPIAVKRLSAVEVNAARSNQREFHAGRLRRELGIPTAGASGDLTAVILVPGSEPLVVETTYTLYQGRQAPRSEYHLYPATRIFLEHAREGDLLLIYREPGSTTLRAFVAPAGSRAETTLLDAMFAGQVPNLDQFRFVDAQKERKGAEAVADTLQPAAPVASPYAVTGHPLYVEALRRRDYPTTREMASAAAEMVSGGAETNGPDDLLLALLDAETALFYAIEWELASAELRTLQERSRDLTSILDFSMKRFQSRKSRRGHSLQNHFEFVLRREEIPYTAQCVPESPPPADIMIPSCESYRDPDFPSGRLRMVSCKTTTRERWYETIPESRRIETKYLLTLDDGMSDNKIAEMWERRVLPFLPQAIIDSAYQGRRTVDRLQNVTHLIAELRAVLD